MGRSVLTFLNTHRQHECSPVTFSVHSRIRRQEAIRVHGSHEVCSRLSVHQWFWNPLTRGESHEFPVESYFVLKRSDLFVSKGSTKALSFRCFDPALDHVLSSISSLLRPLFVSLRLRAPPSQFVPSPIRGNRHHRRRRPSGNVRSRMLAI